MSQWRMNWVWGKVTLAWGGFSVMLAFFAIPLLSLFVGRKRAFPIVARLWTKAMLNIGGVGRRRQEWEDLPEDIRGGRQPAIFMSNHESHLDVPVMISSLEVNAVFIAKQELKRVPFLGQIIWFMNFIFIDRKDRTKAIDSLQKAAARIREGQSVVIFPEGTRTLDGHLRDFKKGGFALAQDAGVPIVPLATVGGFRVLPSGSALIRPGRYDVAVGGPVDPAAYPDRDVLAEEVRRRIEALIAQIRQA